MQHPAATDAAPPLGGPPIGAVLGHYELLGGLGRGGTAELYQARDRRDGTVWALKLLFPFGQDDAALGRFRREFRSLSRLVHPNVVAVRDWGVHDGRPWFTMELVDGDDLRVIQPAWARLDPEDRFLRIQSVLVQCARALAYVHDRGLVHRDVSPGNILVARDGSVKLTDFGLVSDPSVELTRVGELMGTMASLAPEQILGQTVDGRADLYGLGTVLYLLLTGRKPFQAHTTHGWLDRHLHEVPRPPRDLDPLVPESLDRVCTRLLEKDPSNRFASAWHLLHVLGDVEEGAFDDRWPPRLVGRTWYKAWLRDGLDEVAGGRRGGAVLLTGEAGSGRTRLLDLAEQWARRRGLLVCRGRARPHDRPFGAWAPIYEALRPADPPAVLRAVFDPDGGEERVERYLVVTAFRDLVADRAPCVVLLDDLDEADAATRELTEYVVRNCIDLADVPILFVLAQRASESARPALVAAVPAMHRYHLQPLEPSEVEEVVLGLLPPSPTATLLAERLSAETDGSPQFLADMLRGLSDGGVLQRDGARWRVALAAEDVSRSDLPLPDSLRATLVQRLQPLPEATRDLARSLALCRDGVDLDTLVEATGHAEGDVMDAISTLVDAGVVDERRADDHDVVELSHGRFRDVLEAELTGDERRRRHRRLGEILERRNRYALHGVVEDLAWHFEQGGVPPKAYAFLMETARKHIARGLHDEALYHLDRALRAEPEARPYLLLVEADRTLAGLHLDRAAALFHVGQWDLALESAGFALDLAEVTRDPELVCRAATEQGRVLRNLGDTAEAEERLVAALKAADQAGRPALRSAPLYHLGAVRWARHDLPAAEACWQEALDIARQLNDTAAEARAFTGLGILAFCRGRSVEARRLLETCAATYEQLGMIEQLGLPRVNLVELYLITGNLQKGLRMADKLVSQAREVRHVHGIALGMVWRARILMALGRREEARTNAAEALRLAEDLGTKEEEVLALRTLVEIQEASGAIIRASGDIQRLLALLRVQDVEGVLPQAEAMHARCLAAQGATAEARSILEAIQPGGFPHVEVLAHQEVAVAWRELGAPDRARPHLTRMAELAAEAGFRLHEMAAWQELARCDPERAGAHRARATSLARSISAGLERADGTWFLEVGSGAGAR